MRNHTARSKSFRGAAAAVLALLLAPGTAGPAQAEEEGGWSVELGAVYVEAYGHDQHVLTIHELDLDASPPVDDKTAVSLDTDDTFAYRGEFQYARKTWGLGVDFFWFVTTQNVAPRRAAAGGPAGPIDQVVFEVADRRFTSSRPGEVLFYDLLEDTDLEAWTLDLYGTRVLAEGPESAIRLQLGLRLGDFDNDYRAVVGVEGVGGVRLDASSNYDRMMGPLAGLYGEFHRGRNALEGYFGQSLLLGKVEKLTSMSREFTGPFSESPAFVASERFRTDQDVAIPITELRLDWRYRITEHLAAGLGAHASAWWDVPVPPGVVPAAGGDQALHENTVVFFGVLAAVKWRI